MLHWMMNIKGSKQKKHREYTKRLYNTRTDIADIAVVTNTGEYITSGETRPLVTDNALSYYVVKRFKQSGRDSLWLERIRLRLHPREHIQEPAGHIQHKSIKGENNEEIGMLILNVKESYIYSLISEIKLPDEGQLYIVGKTAIM